MPLKGAFDWHYVQCILKKFGTAEYRAIVNIRFLADPFETDSDYSDDECGDRDDTDATWPSSPSYHDDQFRVGKEHETVVVERALSVPTSV